MHSSTIFARQGTNQKRYGIAPEYIRLAAETICTANTGKRMVPVAFAPTRLPCSFHLIIPKGFVGLVNRHGRYVGVWKAGFHVAAPWVSISHLIPHQYTVYDTPVKECPTQDNVMVTIDVALIFRVMVEDEKALYNFAYRLGPDKLDKMLKAFQEEAMRGMVRKRKYNEVYDLMDVDHDRQLEGTKRGTFCVMMLRMDQSSYHCGCCE